MGPVNDIVREAAIQIVQGGNINAIKEEAINAIRTAIATGEPGVKTRPGVKSPGRQVPQKAPDKVVIPQPQPVVSPEASDIKC